MTKSRLYLAAAFSALMLAYSCDVLEKDALPEPDASSSTELVTFSGGAVIFDLSTIVNPLTEAASEVAEAPTAGRLEAIGGLLFRYVPDPAATSDQVVFRTTFSETAAERLDRVSFKMEDPQDAEDSLDLPCTIIAIDDYTNVNTDEAVTIDVMANDYICSSLDLTEFSMCILQQPAWGTATMDEGQLVYTRQPGAIMKVDSVLYKVCSGGPEPACGIAMLHLMLGNEDDWCTMELGDDAAQFSPIEEASKLFINVFENDTICPSKIALFDIDVQPEHGIATIEDATNGIIAYQLSDSDFYGEDTFGYRVCDQDEQCYSASVSVTRAQCQLAALQDYLSIVDSLHADSDLVVLDILGNDVLCGEEPTPVVVESPQHGTATIDELRHLVYSDFESLADTDSVRYRICKGGDICSEAVVKISRN